MIKINSALLLYFAAFILYIIAVFIGSDNLELFSKPIIIPSIYYFYYISVRGKIDYIFSFSILSFFVGEILHLISREDFYISGLLFLLVPYFIILIFLTQDLIYYVKKKKVKLNTFSFYIFLMLLVYLFFNVLMLLFEESRLDFIIYALYGIILLLMGIMTFVMQINYTNKTVLFAGLMVGCFIVSDLFFVFYKKAPDLTALKMINVTTQQLSFFCYISYFIYRTKFKLYGKTNI
ncbi:hypothetical protein [Flavobacterium sp.]|uniref:hypothetical protein n=1 Tax=Flavobacterium sp. TaxID=239 RepID=UPI002FDE9AE4